MRTRITARLLLRALICCTLVGASTTTMTHVYAQRERPELRRESGSVAAARTGDGSVRSVTIPITVRPREGNGAVEVLPTDLTVLEDNESQRVLSLRSTARAPLSIAVLIQDDVVSSISNEINALKGFIGSLPEGSRVMVGYITTGSLRVRQRFTTNLNQAANALRIPLGTASAAPFNPYVEVREALDRFDGLPTGRRAVLLVSDGLDLSRGLSSSSPTQSLDLQRAINSAQRRSVAVYSFYAPTVGATSGGNQTLVSNAQGSLNRLSDETGGRAFFQGTGAPVSFDPFLRDLTTSLNRQYALTYLSTHPKKGFRRVKVETERPDIKIEYPSGYVR